MRLPHLTTTVLGLSLLAVGCAHKKDAASQPSASYYDAGHDMAYEGGPAPASEDAREASASPMPAAAADFNAGEMAAVMPSGVLGTPTRQAAAGSDAGQTAGATEADADAELPTTGADAVDQMLIFTGNLGLMVEADGIPVTIDAAVDLAVRAGGYISQQTDAMLVLRVPSRRFRKLMRGLEGLGEVHTRSVQTLDVSEEFHDLRVRLENLQATRGRIQKLMAQAKDLGEILTVEKELERISAEIDRLEGRLRFLSSQAAFSTVTIAFTEKPREVQMVEDDHPPPPPPPPPPARVLDTSVDWLGEVDVHNLMQLP